MIYALTSRNINSVDRIQIASDIELNDATAIALQIKKGQIAHILCATNQEYYCIFCLIPVFPTDARSPCGQQAQDDWHFEHKQLGDRPGECIGKVRHSQSYAHGLGKRNPPKHGCYVLLGCEVDVNGNQTKRHRTLCQTISSQVGVDRTYCHFAKKLKCIQ